MTSSVKLKIEYGIHRRVARKHKMMALQVGGIEDHLHALVIAPPVYSPSQIAQFLKGDSSKWIHEEFPTMRGFAWQDGYGAFTVSKSNIADVTDYIKNQREHHRARSFQEEYLNFLKKHGIENFICGGESIVADATDGPHLL